MEYGIMLGTIDMDTQRVKKKRPGMRVYVDISSVHTSALAEGRIYVGLSLRHSRYEKLYLRKLIALILKHIFESFRILFDFCIVVHDCLLV
jgi:hypothetical protein